MINQSAAVQILLMLCWIVDKSGGVIAQILTLMRHSIVVIRVGSVEILIVLDRLSCQFNNNGHKIPQT